MEREPASQEQIKKIWCEAKEACKPLLPLICDTKASPTVVMMGLSQIIAVYGKSLVDTDMFSRDQVYEGCDAFLKLSLDSMFKNELNEEDSDD